jgi:hypothetical protein
MLTAWVRHADSVLAEPEPVVVLGIDETRRGRAKWVQDEVTKKWRLTERFETNFVDLQGSQGLLGQASGRTKASVTAWLDTRGQAWKDAVQIVAMDPCASYRAAMREALPNARIVADHFHLVALANQALTEVRRRVTWDTHGRRGRKNDPAWAARRRLLRGRERLSDKQFTKMWNDLIDGDATGKILTAWIAKEETPGAAGHRPHRRPAARHRAPAAPLQQLVRPLRPARTRAPGRHHRSVVARGPGLPADRRHQRRHRGHEPDGQDRRSHRLRLPQPRQPAPPSTVRLHPATPPGHRLLREASPSSSKSRYEPSADLNSR